MTLRKKGKLFDVNGIQLQELDTPMTSWTDSRLKNSKVTYTNDDINVVDPSLYADAENAYNSFFANSLDEGIQRWKDNPNNRFIMYRAENGQKKFVKVMSPQQPTTVAPEPVPEIKPSVVPKKYPEPPKPDVQPTLVKKPDPKPVLGLPNLNIPIMPKSTTMVATPQEALIDFRSLQLN